VGAPETLLQALRTQVCESLGFYLAMLIYNCSFNGYGENYSFSDYGEKSKLLRYLSPPAAMMQAWVV
jgi:hypothetical protein